MDGRIVLWSIIANILDWHCIEGTDENGEVRTASAVNAHCLFKVANKVNAAADVMEWRGSDGGSVLKQLSFFGAPSQSSAFIIASFRWKRYSLCSSIESRCLLCRPWSSMPVLKSLREWHYTHFPSINVITTKHNTRRTVWWWRRRWQERRWRQRLFKSKI